MEKSINLFWKSSSSKDGFYCWCKDCKQKHRTNYYLTYRNREKFLVSKWKKNNKIRWLEYQKEYAKTSKRLDYIQRYHKKSIVQFKNKARYIVRNALRKGILEKLNCKFFGDKCFGRIEAHHHDYTKPLKVLWLCIGHHRKLHFSKNF